MHPGWRREVGALQERIVEPLNGWVGDGDRLCATREGETMHYVFSTGRGDCPSGCIERDYTHVTTDAAGVVTQVDTASNPRSEADPPLPEWVSLYATERCLRRAL